MVAVVVADGVGREYVVVGPVEEIVAADVVAEAWAILAPRWDG